MNSENEKIGKQIGTLKAAELLGRFEAMVEIAAACLPRLHAKNDGKNGLVMLQAFAAHFEEIAKSEFVQRYDEIVEAFKEFR